MTGMRSDCRTAFSASALRDNKAPYARNTSFFASCNIILKAPPNKTLGISAAESSLKKTQSGKPWEAILYTHNFMEVVLERLR